MSETADPVVQARKALAERHPFDADEPAAQRAPNLPAALAAVLARGPDGRRKHKKAHHGGEGLGEEKKHTGPGRPPKPPTIWEQKEDYFRPITLADIELLIPKLPFGSVPLDSCLCVPVIGSSTAKQEASLNDVAEPASLDSNSVPVVKEAAEKTEVVAEKKQAKEIVVSDSGVNVVVEDSQEEEEDSSLNWLLRSKERFILTSERPNKKRKLLGGDAGLERLLRLPREQDDTGAAFCSVCCLGEYNAKSDGLVVCDSCKVSVHRRCYGVHESLGGRWLCSWCKHLEEGGKVSQNGEVSGLRPCMLCPKGGGALKPVQGDESSTQGAMKFAHLFCGLWAPEVYVEDTRAMEPVVNVGGVREMRTRLVCYLCKVKHGVCVRCSHGTCRTSFHPLCAREAKHQMEIWGKPGCDNVELRAFCVKHSSLQEKHVAKNTKVFAKAVENGSSTGRTLSTCLPSSLLLKLRLNRNNKDKSVKQDEEASSFSEDMVKDETSFEQDVLGVESRTDGQVLLRKNEDIEGGTENCNKLSSSCNLIQVLKKLIDRGKFSVGEVASKMVMSCNSLEALLADDATSLSPELKSKIIKWIEDSAHFAVPRLPLNFKSDSAMSSDSLESRTAGLNTDNFRGLHVRVGAEEAELSVPDNLSEPRAPQRGVKGSTNILKEAKALNSSEEIVHSNDNGKLVDENDEVPEDCNFTECPEMMLEDSVNTPSQDKGNLVMQEKHDVSGAEHQIQHKVELPFASRIVKQVEDAYITERNVLNECKPVGLDCDVSTAVHHAPDLKNGESCCSSYVHPFIKKKMIQVQKCMHFEQENKEAKPNGLTGDAGNVDQLANTRDEGMLDLSPEDELEGEILYLQNKLVNNALEMKRSCEDLICRVLRNLPQELDTLKKRRWDLVLVSQYLRELREVKKRGRRERKHKEAQAVVAAAAAAAASSSRNSSLRKDANDELISAHQEIPVKVTTISGRASLYSSLLPRPKETLSRSPVVKVPPDRLAVTFQVPDISKESVLSCDICRRGETILNRIFVCSSCKVAVHLDCYRKFKDPIGSWKCELCDEMSLQSASTTNQTADGREIFSSVTQCGLCGGTSGAFRKSTTGQWVHAFCAEWLLESTYKRGQNNLVDGMEAISSEKDLLPCSICHQKFGACLKCSYGHCQITFHPSCARSTGLYMNVKNIAGRLMQKAYCAKHSMEQREADIKQHGAEELKKMKQTRVELEKLRLLCERIIKREKLKREMVLCSHEIHASRRDCIAFSALARPSFYRGGSSESATTSVDDKSYSGIQKSDDITVDSAVCSSSRAVRLPTRMDIDRRTDESSSCQLSFKRKLDDRTTFSGKQLPHRPASVAFRCSADSGEKKSKARKQTETFQKELVMTSVQASIQNRRLPKGFVYIPVGCLSEEKPVTGDSKSPEAKEPGG